MCLLFDVGSLRFHGHTLENLGPSNTLGGLRVMTPVGIPLPSGYVLTVRTTRVKTDVSFSSGWRET